MAVGVGVGVWVVLEEGSRPPATPAKLDLERFSAGRVPWGCIGVCAASAAAAGWGVVGGGSSPGWGLGLGLRLGLGLGRMFGFTFGLNGLVGVM